MEGSSLFIAQQTELRYLSYFSGNTSASEPNQAFSALVRWTFNLMCTQKNFSLLIHAASPSEMSFLRHWGPFQIRPRSALTAETPTSCESVHLVNTRAPVGAELFWCEQSPPPDPSRLETDRYPNPARIQDEEYSAHFGLPKAAQRL